VLSVSTGADADRLARPLTARGYFGSRQAGLRSTSTPSPVTQAT
jgi:hypothetical protein